MLVSMVPAPIITTPSRVTGPGPDPVEPVAHDDAADPGADEQKRVGQGGHATGPVEILRNLL